MTTRVTIANNSYDREVKIEVQGRDEHGQFTATREVIIPPRQITDEVVYDGCSLQVIEVKKEA